MKVKIILLIISVLTSLGGSSAEATSNAALSRAKTHAESLDRPKIVTLSKLERKKKVEVASYCYSLQGATYVTALIGLQATLILLPAFSSGVGTPVGAIATSLGILASGIGFVAMVAHDSFCKGR